MDIPTLKWKEINMDLFVGLSPIMMQNDSIRVIVERLTKSAHFIPVKSTYPAEDYT